MVVIVFTVGAAVKPAANSLPEDTKEPEPTPPTTEAVQQEPYPFNLMSLDWSGEELEGWTRYEVPEDYADHGGYFPECMQQFTYIICKQNGVDYALVLAIIETESGYRWDATSSEGSTGYMQVLAKWHEERMHRLNVDNVENPYFNIMVGVDYLAELQERFDTEAEVLTAYNSGAIIHLVVSEMTKTLRTCGSAGIGRQARLRIWWSLRSCGFKSHLPQNENPCACKGFFLLKKNQRKFLSGSL